LSSSGGSFDEAAGLGSSALELDEELELELLDSEPGIGGADPGNGYLSAADGCFGRGASGTAGESLPGIGGGASPGNGNRWETEGSFCVGAQGSDGLSFVPAAWLPVASFFAEAVCSDGQFEDAAACPCIAYAFSPPVIIVAAANMRVQVRFVML